MRPCMLDKTSGVRIYTKNKNVSKSAKKVAMVAKKFQKLSGNTFSPKNASSEDATPELISNHCLVVKTTGVGDGNYRK